MPAIPVAPNGARSIIPEEVARTLQRQGIFERGDHVYLQTPVQRFTPSDGQIEEFAFSQAVKSKAPNENIVWFKGQYVEADNPNGNGAQWHAKELAIKSLTPMLMPVTVMHDPRTAVGTIADVQMLTPEKDGVPRARIDTVLALWGHRFPEAVKEAEINAEQGTLMQSMECYSPWYECSACGEVFHKLPLGAEKAMWCDHLRASNPSAGSVDWMGSSASGQSSDASRILGDVCFTGTGLIFGTRGAKGAYSEAFLTNFEDEVASFHQTVHTSTAEESNRGVTNMGLVQIEQSELDTLRKERDDARAEAQTFKTEAETAKAEKAAAETAAEQAEAAKTAAEAERDTAKQELTAKNEELAGQQLKDKRLGELGDGFMAKLGDFTKTRLQEQASKLSDEDWDNRLKELEETASVRRDAGKTTTDDDGDKNKDNTLFEREEVARLGVTSEATTSAAPSRVEQSSVVGALASAFKPAK